MKFEIGQSVELNGKEYKITSKHKRSYILERDGKKYKAGPAKLKSILNQEPVTKNTGTKYLEKRLQFDRIFNKDAQLPKTEAEIMNYFSRLECELSPENLHCDGEISLTQARAKKREIMGAWRELENLLGRKVNPEY